MFYLIYTAPPSNFTATSSYNPNSSLLYTSAGTVLPQTKYATRGVSDGGKASHDDILGARGAPGGGKVSHQDNSGDRGDSRGNVESGSQISEYQSFYEANNIRSLVGLGMPKFLTLLYFDYQNISLFTYTRLTIFGRWWDSVCQFF